MCDYSLEMYGSRPAREGEVFVTTRFPTGSIGFAAPGDPTTAICLQCDTPVELLDVPTSLQVRYHIAADTAVTFTQSEPTSRFGHRDGLRMPNGAFVSLQELPTGLRACVTSLLENMPAKEMARSLEGVR